MEIFSSFIISFGFSLMFLAEYRSKALSSSYIILFFMVLFLSGIAAQYWIIPFGPAIYGVYWMPLLLVMAIVTLLFAAPSPYQNKRRRGGNEADNRLPVNPGIFIWLLLLVLLLAIATGVLCKEPDKMATEVLKARGDCFVLVVMNKS